MSGSGRFQPVPDFEDPRQFIGARAADLSARDNLSARPLAPFELNDFFNELECDPEVECGKLGIGFRLGSICIGPSMAKPRLRKVNGGSASAVAGR